MNKKEILDQISQNPVFHLATIEKGEPRVRGMLLYKADDEGIVFHTAKSKELFLQLVENPQAELCFNAKGTQIRIRGKLEQIEDIKVIDEIFAHPSRQFLRDWEANGEIQNRYENIGVFILRNGKASTWTMSQNFAAKEYTQL